MKTIISFLAMAFIAVSVFGQTGLPKGIKTAEERAAKNTERLKTELALSADQEAKIKEINLSSAKRMDEIAKTSAADAEAARKSAKAVRTEQDTKIKAVLNPEQIAKYDALAAKMEGEYKDKAKQSGAKLPIK